MRDHLGEIITIISQLWNSEEEEMTINDAALLADAALILTDASNFLPPPAHDPDPQINKFTTFRSLLEQKPYKKITSNMPRSFSSTFNKQQRKRQFSFSNYVTAKK